MLSSSLAPHATQLPAEESTAAAPAPAPTTFAELLDLATRQHPELRAARARADAAYGMLVQAGLYPNPMVGLHHREIGHRDNAWGEIGPSVSQTIITGGKRGLDQAAALDALSAADWQALTRWFAVVTRLRLAYVDLLAAQRERDTLQKLTRITQDIEQATLKLEQTGAATRPDVLRARVELEQQSLKKTVADRAVDTARRTLAAALGAPDADLTGLRGSLDQSPPGFEFDDLVARTMTVSAELQEARALVAQQENLVRRAEVESIPNVNVELLPFYAAPDHEWRGDVAITAAIPIFNRNEGAIHAARADLARARAEEQALSLRLRERLAVAYQRYQAARLQAEAYAKRILPNAEESLRLIEVAYQRGDAKYNYTVLLQAQQALFQAQLSQVQALGEWHRAAAELMGLAQIKE